MSRLSELLRDRRHKLRLTQTQIAVCLGMRRGPETVSLWERGTRLPAQKNLADIAMVYGIEIGELMAAYGDMGASPLTSQRICGDCRDWNPDKQRTERGLYGMLVRMGDCKKLNIRCERCDWCKDQPLTR